MCLSIRLVMINNFCKLLFRHKNNARLLFFPFSTSNVIYKNYRPPINIKKPQKVTTLEEDEDENTKNLSEEKELDVLLEKTFLNSKSGHQIFIIQPFIKWGPDKKRNTTPKLQLQESITLIKTLREWKVVDCTIISLENFHTNTLFGKGNLAELTEKIRNNAFISAVFISVNTLTFRQQSLLEKIFGVPVFDRYTIIMHIFREHAQTKEAKLQIQLAQLPYLWKVIRGFNTGIGEKLGISGVYLGGEGPKTLETRKEVFRVREAKLRRQILELREQRKFKREQRNKSEIPVVSVLGYTNAGKTALIKALTGKISLEPKNYLFATLDVTSHLGVLPSGMEVYFVDTLGFISDIPTYLIESFVHTLEDAVSAHVIIHVRDISHPDTEMQNDNVIQTLKDMKLSEDSLNNVITVGNKVDLVKLGNVAKFNDLILVSSTKMIGIDFLRQEIEKKVLVKANKLQIVIKVRSGGEEYSWLHDNSTVVEETPDIEDSQFMLVKTIISSSSLAKFRHHFIKKFRKR